MRRAPAFRKAVAPEPVVSLPFQCAAVSDRDRSPLCCVIGRFGHNRSADRSLVCKAPREIQQERRQRAEAICVAVKGIDPLIATALVTAMNDRKTFRNGRQAAAWLGLESRQRSSGGKARLLSISKRGGPYLRTLLVHGALSGVPRQPKGRSV
jgi:transposase